VSPRRRALLTGVAVLILVAAVVAVVRGAWPDGRRTGAFPPQDRPGPVMLVPGYGGGTGGLGVLAERLRAAGREPIVVIPPGDGTGDLAEQAAALDRAVVRELRAGAPSVDVVGHSAGGVVARLWVQEHDGAHKARRIVTLGSPHHGATVAAAGAAAVPGACPTACRQLAPGSSLLADLAAPVPNPPAWLSIWTRQDETVTPPESAELEGAVNVAVQSLCPQVSVSHGELPSHPFVAGLVIDALGAEPLTAPTPGRCDRVSS
jgi:pimeloyl-ACP methyl ester carboxylesterase